MTDHLQDERDEGFEELDGLLRMYRIPVREGFADEVMASLPDEVDRLLALDRVAVREGFAEEVMAALPEARWQRQRHGVWAAAIAVALGLSLAGAWFLGRDLGSSSFFTSVAALGDLLATGMLAGAGLLTATWSGLGSTVGAALRGSPTMLLALGAVVVLLNVVLFRLLRRRRPRAAEAASSRSPKG